MLKTINPDGSLKISLISGAVPAGAFYNGGLAYHPDGTLYVKRVVGAISGAFYNGGLATTPDGALYVADGTAASDVSIGGVRCRADGVARMSSGSIARWQGGIPTDDVGAVVVGPPLANLAAAFDASINITSSGGFASQWSDLSGNARHLLQATGANQPIHLPFTGTKYGWLSGVAGNYYSTPDSAANSITGDIDIRAKATLTDWTPAALQVLVAKDDNGSNRDYLFYVETTGVLVFTYSNDGATRRSATGLTATGISDGATKWVRVTYETATGETKFYTSDDGSTWTQLGVTITITAGTIHNGTGEVRLGQYTSGSLNGRIHQAQIYNGINGTLAVDFDPSRWSSGTTFTASTGETWTINSTGAKPAQIVDRASLLFDGTAHKMATAAFTLDQPSTHYYVMRHITWTSGDVLADGLSANTGALAQTTGTPKISINAGAAAAENSDLALGTWKVVCVVINGASSSIQVGTEAETTGDAGAGDMGGLMLGADGAGLNYGNAQFSEDLHYNVAHDAATRANIIAALNSKWGLS